MPHWLYLPDEDLSGSKRCKTDEVDVDDVSVLEGCLTTFMKSLADPHSLQLEGPVVLETRLTPHKDYLNTAIHALILKVMSKILELAVPKV